MLSLVCALLLLTPGERAQWPGFLGTGASSLAAEELPLEWSPEKNIAWTAEIPGDGQSSPIVWGDRVITTSVTGPMKEEYHTLCWKLSDGTLLWEHTLKNSVPVKSTLYVSRAAPTPATDGERVYVFFESGDVLALSMDGKPLWQRSLTKEYGAYEGNHGLGSSPVLTKKGVVLLVDHDGPSYLISLSKEDGSTLWKTDRESRISWSSPMRASLKAGEQIVCSSSGSLDGYDPKTGEKLWSLGDLSGNTVASPLSYDGETMLVGASSGRGEQAEAGATRSNAAVQVRKNSAGELEPHVLWSTDKATSSFGSPIVHGKQAYWVNRTGVVYCLDAETGDVLYNKRLKQSCWATPLAVENRLYFFGKGGHTTVLKAGKEYEVLAENVLWDDEAKEEAAPNKEGEKPKEKADPAASIFGGTIQYGVAAVDGSLLIRTGNKLYCVRK